jgi:hypothetical protein
MPSRRHRSPACDLSHGCSPRAGPPSAGACSVVAMFGVRAARRISLRRSRRHRVASGRAKRARRSVADRDDHAGALAEPPTYRSFPTRLTDEPSGPAPLVLRERTARDGGRERPQERRPPFSSKAPRRVAPRPPPRARPPLPSPPPPCRSARRTVDAPRANTCSLLGYGRVRSCTLPDSEPPSPATAGVPLGLRPTAGGPWRKVGLGLDRAPTSIVALARRVS